jgi:hypothetical protein
MRRLHAILTLILAVIVAAMVVSLVGSRRAQRELRQQLQTLTDANKVLRESLGELTTAITQKEKQIDDLQQSGRSGLPSTPAPQKKKTSADEL